MRAQKALFEKKEEIIKICQEYNVSFLVLFGSQATRKARPESDIDLAVYFQKPPPAEKELNFFHKIAQALQTDRFDLVVLNHANPTVAKEVALTGEVLFEKRKDDFDYFLIRAINLYLETKPLREANERNLKNYIKEKVK